ncbi:hypothetical protein KIPB_015684, partial [Kipferlia bialata]
CIEEASGDETEADTCISEFLARDCDTPASDCHSACALEYPADCPTECGYTGVICGTECDREYDSCMDEEDTTAEECDAAQTECSGWCDKNQDTCVTDCTGLLWESVPQFGAPPA